MKGNERYLSGKKGSKRCPTLAIKRWRIEAVEAQVGDSVSLILKHANKGCSIVISIFRLIEISFPIQ